jgi:hypothetical protein
MMGKRLLQRRLNKLIKIDFFNYLTCDVNRFYLISKEK